MVQIKKEYSQQVKERDKMTTVRISKHKGSNVGHPTRKVVYDIVARRKNGGILDDETAFNKKAANRIVS